MKKLDRFTVKAFLGPFALTFTLVMFVLVMQFLWLYIDDLVGKGLSFGVILEFMGWGACTVMPMAMPLATLLASIMTLGSMGENNELLAMKAAGTSLPRIMRPLVIVAMVIVVGAFFISNNLIPVAYRNIYALQYDIAQTKEEIKIPTGTFYDGVEGYIIRIDDRNEDTGMMFNVMVYDHTASNGNTNVTIADSSRMEFTPDKKSLMFTLYNGCTYSETNDIHYRDTSLTLDRIDFREQQLVVPLENYAFSRSSGGRFDDQVMSKGLKALSADHDSLTSSREEALTLQRSRAKASNGLRYMYQLDSAHFGKMKGAFPADSATVLKWADTKEMLSAIQRAKSAVAGAMQMSDSFEREDFRYVDPLRRVDTERFRKFTLSVACLIFFFIGAPLGAIIRKGGIGTPTIVSILFFVLYWVVDISGKKLSRDGNMTPFMGAFISTMVMAPIGILLTWQSTRDSSMFNPAAFFKKIRDDIREFFAKRHRRNHRIVFMGTPDFAVTTLDGIVSKGYTVAAVVTTPDKASGRGLKVNESAVKKYAVAHGIPVLQPERLRDEEFIAQLRSFKAEVFCVVAFRMLPKEVWSIPELGTFNLHASLLPQYRGAAPINWAIINGDRITGLTTFFIDEKIDTGKIISSKECLIENSDDFGTTHDKMAAIGSQLAVDTLDRIIEGKAVALPQRIAEGEELLPAPKLTRENTTICWNRTAKEVWNLVRGLSPYPTAHTTLHFGDKDIEVKIFSGQWHKFEELPASLQAKYNEKQSEPVPGSILSDGRKELAVVCGSGFYSIGEIQAAGKKRMEAAAFLAGMRGIEEASFV